jgi:SpoVK/Ycf46/Vps4 family AAA+-type ATPase
MIKYQSPHREDRLRIWQVMTRQFELKVDDELIEQLVDLFPEATGRDIKGLTKLVSKYCQHKKVPAALDVFKRCSIFRGMEISHADQGGC